MTNKHEDALHSIIADAKKSIEELLSDAKQLESLIVDEQMLMTFQHGRIDAADRMLTEIAIEKLALHEEVQ